MPDSTTTTHDRHNTWDFDIASKWRGWGESLANRFSNIDIKYVYGFIVVQDNLIHVLDRSTRIVYVCISVTHVQPSPTWVERGNLRCNSRPRAQVG